MSITPDMLSRPPGDGEVFCFIHGIGKFQDGGCAQCIELMKDPSIVACAAHGIQTRNEAGACPHCPAGTTPPPPKVFDPPPDVPPQGVSPKPGYGRAAAPRPPRRTE